MGAVLPLKILLRVLPKSKAEKRVRDVPKRKARPEGAEKRVRDVPKRKARPEGLLLRVVPKSKWCKAVQMAYEDILVQNSVHKEHLQSERITAR
jgi:hypothetical protein